MAHVPAVDDNPVQGDSEGALLRLTSPTEFDAMDAAAELAHLRRQLTAAVQVNGCLAEQLTQEVAERQRAEERIRRLARVASMLSGVNALIARVQTREELYREACRIAVQVGQFTKAWIGLVSKAWLVDMVACEGRDTEYFEQLRSLLRNEPPPGFTRFREALQLGQPYIVNDLATDTNVRLRDLATQAGSRSLVWLPLVADGPAIAVLVLHADTVGFFDADEMKMLRELAGNMAFAFEHIAQREQLSHLAYYDPLTDLANNTLFRERLEQRLCSAAASYQRLAVVLFDLTRFKVINDTLGRHAGDALLIKVASRLLQAVGDSAQLARISGDRFALMLPDVRAESEVGRWAAEHHRKVFCAPFVVEEHDLRVSAKVGIAVYPDDGADAETLYRNAEAAVKNAKGSTETTLFYSPQMSASVADALAMENNLRLALERDEFVLHYQPKVEVDSRRMVGVEALIRWNRPGHGLVPPLQFIPLLEETGLILDVGAWALRRAAQDYRRWQRRSVATPRIAVNVSALQLHRHDFVATVLAELTDEPNQTPLGIDIEITESMVMKDVETCIGKLQALRAHGVQVSIDDFGTGYSSLAYLSKLPAQYLKIDRAFVFNMLIDPDDMMLVSTMISLAHSMRMKVVAEGVESEEQAKILRLLRCDQMQGFLISPAVDTADIERLLITELDG